MASGPDPAPLPTVAAGEGTECFPLSHTWHGHVQDGSPSIGPQSETPKAKPIREIMDPWNMGPTFSRFSCPKTQFAGPWPLPGSVKTTCKCQTCAAAERETERGRTREQIIGKRIRRITTAEGERRRRTGGHHHHQPGQEEPSGPGSRAMLSRRALTAFFWRLPESGLCARACPSGGRPLGPRPPD